MSFLRERVGGLGFPVLKETRVSPVLAFQSLEVPMAKVGELQVRYPAYVTFRGCQDRLTVREDLPADFIGDSALYPLKRITLLEKPTQRTQDDKVLRYSPQRGGTSEIYLGDIWQIAKDFNDNKIKDAKGYVKWWSDWVINLQPSIRNWGKQQGEQDETVVLWQGLVADIIVSQASLTEISLQEQLFKKTLVDSRMTYAGAAALVAAMSLIVVVAERTVPDLPCVAVPCALGIIAGEETVRTILPARLKNHISQIKKRKLDQLLLGEPLVSLR